MARSPRYLLVIQVPIGTTGDIDRLCEAEERLDALLRDLGQTGGHSAASGEGNLFIQTDTPELVLRKALPCLDEKVRDLARAAYREIEGETFTPLWPPDLKEFRVL